MNILLLGYGQETQAAEKYFQTRTTDANISILDPVDSSALPPQDYSSYDIIFRSPSVPPTRLENESSVTEYFFEHCPCPIIGVTATKGKGTTCSLIKALLDAHHEDAYLVGNIGVPAIEVLDQLQPTSVVVYELSSFQLWTLRQSPHISVIGHLEPDHLNVHPDFADYLAAKGHICRYQKAGDYCIYNASDQEAAKLAAASPAHKIPYPLNPSNPDLAAALAALPLPGQHNCANAMAALATVASFYNISPDEYLRQHQSAILAGFKGFHGLPHRLEYLRTLHGVQYYDDNFSTNPSSTRVAVQAFPGHPLVLILGGRDKTGYQDLPEIHEILQAPQVRQVVLIGESGRELAKQYKSDKFLPAGTLTEAVNLAQTAAENLAVEARATAKNLAAETQATAKATTSAPIVLMSPAAASFDMFENVYDRGAKFQQAVQGLR